MKKLYNIVVGIVMIGITLTSCLDTKSDQILLPSDLDLNSPDKNFYSMNGVLNQLEKLTLRYVILGELRGDLMETTSYSDEELNEVYNFEAGPDNKFNNVGDYYSVINLCNYMIANIDTAITMKNEQVNLRDYAAAKGIRAWTYMQLALNYGEAKYYTNVIEDVSDANKNYPSYGIEELAGELIDDLIAWRDIQAPDKYESANMFFSIRMLLGDMYLWTGQYESAAREYYHLINNNPATTQNAYYIDVDYNNRAYLDNNTIIGWRASWHNLFRGLEHNTITLVNGSSEYNAEGSPLDSLNQYMNELAPSDIALNNWDSQIYYVTSTITDEGDYRGETGTAGSYSLLSSNTEKGQIVKFQNLSTETRRSVVLYRAAHLYLRYAEAVNRLGKPNLAFAVLKNGLGPYTLANDNLVPRHEKYSTYTDTTGTLIGYVDFTASNYITTIVDDDEVERTVQRNIGVHKRGCGNVELSETFIIPEQASLEDSIQYVEDKIIEELALETAFEGNRFHDLMRIAKRRGSNAYLADKVAEKYTNADAIRAKLMEEANWYLPTK
ncbi:RagB/SusD family nutrient uptake outer membrane protein [Carboxylicivirga linearis]|uniref:RagB/SusD family nutrient uptake outer membrane protein n=1 Tax=Carboxylicivirga linearis TaxID=1628157 RepID=A0ABS5JXR4_9BACT|nr:RagB/SusD family nutrient uptake outer membrane protein [Carboxylicivirga linearis]MBS2099628.1 RagB/SusD family nutrient uptake outer membrane protein [Carboxylicivirga linearis]